MSKGFLAWEQGCSTATIFHVLLRCAFSSLLLRVLHGPEKKKKTQKNIKLKKKKKWAGCCLERGVSFSPGGVEEEMASCSLATLGPWTCRVCREGDFFNILQVGSEGRMLEGEPEELRSLGGFGQLSASTVPISIKEMFWVPDTVPVVRRGVWCFCRWPLVVLSVLDGIWCCFLSLFPKEIPDLPPRPQRCQLTSRCTAKGILQPKHCCFVLN